MEPSEIHVQRTKQVNLYYPQHVTRLEVPLYYATFQAHSYCSLERLGDLMKRHIVGSFSKELLL